MLQVELGPKRLPTCATKLRMRQKHGGTTYSAVVSQFGFGSAIALVVYRAMALPNPNWLRVALHVVPTCFCRLRGSVAHVVTLWASINSVSVLRTIRRSERTFVEWSFLQSFDVPRCGSSRPTFRYRRCCTLPCCTVLATWPCAERIGSSRSGRRTWPPSTMWVWCSSGNCAAAAAAADSILSTRSLVQHAAADDVQRFSTTSVTTRTMLADRADNSQILHSVHTTQHTQAT